MSPFAPVLLAALTAVTAEPPSSPGHPYHREQHKNAPAEMWAVIEIPLGSTVKYEFDKATGHVFVDRFQSMPVAAPANYGSFPRAERDRIAAYFRVYKQLPAGLEGRILESSGREVAERFIREAMEAYRKGTAGPR